MARRKISAREAVADIRSGKSDAVLMEKYGLTAAGLQSLFDKLVSAGYLDLSEMQGRMPSFVGTVVIPQPHLHHEEEDSSGGAHSHPGAKRTLINAQEAARDIRAGMSDSALMEKHRLSAKGLQSMFNKLMALKTITQHDLDTRSLDADHTVDLREQMPTLSQALAHWESGYENASTDVARDEIRGVTPQETVKRHTDKTNQSRVGQPIQPREKPVLDKITQAGAKPVSTSLVVAGIGLLILLVIIWFLAIPWMR